MAAPTPTTTDLGKLGRPFDACPTIRIFSDPSLFRSNLQQSGLAEIAGDLAGDMSSAWEKEFGRL